MNIIIGSFPGFDSTYGYPYGSNNGTINRSGWSTNEPDAPGHGTVG